jgi:hypothetical protein
MLGMLGLMCLFLVSAWSSPIKAEPGHNVPLAGFSFSPKLMRWAGYQPLPSLRLLLEQTQPDLVRLPIYWDSVAPTPGSMNFSESDELVDTVAQYNSSRPSHRARVVLVVGARNFGAPELHAPTWLEEKGSQIPLVTQLRSAAYLDYMESAFHRYASSPLLYGWQIENEPLDSTNPALGDIALPEEVVAQEIKRAHQWDAFHPVAVTTFNSTNLALDEVGGLFQKYTGWNVPAGHLKPALHLGDVLGINAYVVTPNAPDQVSVYRRIVWKQQSLEYWARAARSQHKQVWVTEMQAAPWKDVRGFTQKDLETSAQLYTNTGISAVFLWGAEEWMQSPAWLAAATRAIDTLSSSSRRP